MPVLRARRNLQSCLACVFILLACAAFNAQAQRRPDTDESVVSRSTLVASGELVELYQDGVPVDATFLPVLENTYRRIEQLLRRPLDKATLGEKIRVHVTDSTGVSHVWRGYQNQRDPRGVIILSRRAYFDGRRGENATYAHEMTHLFTWRFHSHTLREGLADYVALEIFPGAVVGPNTKGYDWTGKLPSEVLDLLGTTIDAPAGVTNDMRLRQAYYFGSYRFVKLLIDKGGLAKFMQLYAAPDPETAFVALYGASRAALVQEIPG